jgi:hypothetical protein
MSHAYAAGFSRAGINTANSPVVNLNNTATSSRLYILEVGVGVATAPTTAPSFYLSRATARGTQTATLTGQPLDPAEVAAIGTLDSTWSANPTFSTTNFITRGGLAVTAGGFMVWTFYDHPLIVPATVGAGVTLANANASGATLGLFTGYFKWEE